ncbi:type IV secretion system protein [Francisellaceae bacterium]|nr:type IV secretion system protein [Francisellaceae bacterium]
MAEQISKLDPKLFDSIQAGFIDAVQKGFDAVQTDATNLFYVLAGLELALFGLAWVIRQEEAFGLLVLKIVKIGLFFAFITYFPALVNSIMQGFLKEAYTVASDKGAIYLFHPGKVWEIGFKAGVSMMKLAVEYGSYNYGMSLIYLILGFGLLFMFTLIGAQIILVVSLFYLLLILTLILIPLGLIKPMEDFFYQAAQSLFKAGARVFTVAIILGVAFTLWKGFKLTNISETTGLEKPMGLFFLTLVILFLLWKLPGIMADSIGRVGGNIFDGIFGSSSSTVNVSGGQPVAMQGGYSGGGQVSAAAVMSSGGGAAPVSGASIAAATTVVGGAPTSISGGGSSSSGAAPSVTVNATGTAAAVNSGNKAKSGGVDQASSVSISKDTLNKLQDTVKQAMNTNS